MSNHIVEWCRRKQDRFNKEGKPYAAKLMGLMAGYFYKKIIEDLKKEGVDKNETN